MIRVKYKDGSEKHIHVVGAWDAEKEGTEDPLRIMTPAEKKELPKLRAIAAKQEALDREEEELDELICDLESKRAGLSGAGYPGWRKRLEDLEKLEGEGKT